MPFWTELRAHYALKISSPPDWWSLLCILSVKLWFPQFKLIHRRSSAVGKSKGTGSRSKCLKVGLLWARCRLLWPWSSSLCGKRGAITWKALFLGILAQRRRFQGMGTLEGKLLWMSALSKLTQGRKWTVLFRSKLNNGSLCRLPRLLRGAARPSAEITVGLMTLGRNRAINRNHCRSMNRKRLSLTCWRRVSASRPIVATCCLFQLSLHRPLSR